MARPMRRMLLAAVLVLTALALGACGGDSGGSDAGGDQAEADRVDARTWAEDVCGSARRWLDENQARSAEIQQGPAPSTPREGREVVVRLVSEMVASGDEMVNEIEAAGTPDVDRGEEAQEGFVSLMQQLVDAFRTTEGELAELPLDERFGEELQATMARMDERVDDIDYEQLEETTDPELDALFDEIDDCQAVAANADS